MADDAPLQFFVYLLTCADQSFYCGWSTDPQARLVTHNAGKGAKYTRARLPVVLSKVWQLPTKQEALRFEHAVKKLSRAQKQALLLGKALPQLSEFQSRPLEGGANP